MKTKIIALSLALALVPTMAQAKSHRVTSVGKYTYTIHRSQHYKCAYVGCHKDFTQH